MQAKKRNDVFRVSKDLADKVIRYCKETGKSVEELLNEVMEGIVQESGMGNGDGKGRVLVKDIEIKVAIPAGLDVKLMRVANSKGLTKFRLVRDRLRQVVEKV
jgi:hypothetical protein